MQKISLFKFKSGESRLVFVDGDKMFVDIETRLPIIIGDFEYIIDLIVDMSNIAMRCEDLKGSIADDYIEKIQNFNKHIKVGPRIIKP